MYVCVYAFQMRNEEQPNEEWHNKGGSKKSGITKLKCSIRNIKCQRYFYDHFSTQTLLYCCNYSDGVHMSLSHAYISFST